MAFSIVGILSVLLEVIRPLLPLLIAVLVIDAAMLVLALRRGTLASAGAIRLSVLVGGVVAVITFFIAPAFTNSSFANLSGALDYLSLVGGALGVGALAALLILPPMALLQRSEIK